MAKILRVNKYRKIENIDFDFSKNVNLIAGTNGTCKTSILYIISNAYQKVIKAHATKEVRDCLNIIQEINGLMNPKIESLTKGDKEYNDPAPHHTGKLYEVEYMDGSKLEFRKHNSAASDRYSVKPKYSNTGQEKLPEMPIIYLGLSRLISFGEYNEINMEHIKKTLENKIPNEHIKTVETILNKEINNIKIQNVKKKMPDVYQQEINDLFRDFTGIGVLENTYNKVANLKHRADFTSNVEGVDSNTISAGEDNLYMIITALVSLKYYYESIVTDDAKLVESIFLIDEIDATLHPSYQLKLIKLIRDFSEKYKIQFLGTSHSITLLEYSMEMQDNVIYLLDSENNVTKINDELNINSIKMFLREQTAMQMKHSKIPIFSEDKEARVLLDILFDYFSENMKGFFPIVRNYFHLVDANISSEALINIFNDYTLSNDFLRSICILDGDQHSRASLSNNIICLPGNKSPESLLFEYLRDVIDENKELYKNFWDSTSPIIKKGYQKKVVRELILNKVDEIEAEISQKRSASEPTKGLRRIRYKRLFNEHIFLFTELFNFWIHDKDTSVALKRVS